MKTAKLFQNGQSQAVRLPKECRFTGSEVAINQIGNIVILMPKDDKWSGFLDSLGMATDDFMEDGRMEPENQERELI